MSFDELLSLVNSVCMGYLVPPRLMSAQRQCTFCANTGVCRNAHYSPPIVCMGYLVPPMPPRRPPAVQPQPHERRRSITCKNCGGPVQPHELLCSYCKGAPE